MIRNKIQSLRSQITRCKSDESTKSSSVVYTQIKRQKVTGNSNNNSSNSDSDNGNYNDNKKIIKENLVKAGERFIQRCQHIATKAYTKSESERSSGCSNISDNNRNDGVSACEAEEGHKGFDLQRKIKNNRIVSSQKRSPLSSISASLLHMEEENVCASTNIARCTCNETYSRALSRRRDAVYEVEVDERIGLRLYTELILKKRLIDSYF